MTAQQNDPVQENNALKNQVQQLSISLEAHKQMVNEGLQTSLVLRTNMIAFQKQIQELSMKLQSSQVTIDNLNKQLSEATAKPVAA